MSIASLLSHERPNPARAKVQWGVEIATRDGIKLSGILYEPLDRTCPTPVIVTVTPYVSQRYHDIGLLFAAAGFVYLVVDVRGRGNSKGEFHPPFKEAEDCYDVIEWLAKQPCCDGRIAMWGGSYSGYLQWAAAKLLPPNLKTIVPMASPFRGLDSPAPDNIFMPYRIQWLALIADRCSQETIFADQRFWDQQFLRWFKAGAAFREIDSFLGFPSPIFQEWLAHPSRDAYWDNHGLSADEYRGIVIPTLTITGCYDANQRGALAHYREHQDNTDPVHHKGQYLVIGPWNHAGIRVPQPEFGGLKGGRDSLLNLLELNRQWFDWILRGAAKPEFLQKNVAYYVMGAEEWRYCDTLDAVTAGYTELFLHSQGNPIDVVRSGFLSPVPAPSSGPDHYVYDPRDVSLGELESTLGQEYWADQKMVYASVGKQLVYHSEPFEADTLVAGFFKFTGWVSIDQPDTDFKATVYLIDLDGSSIMLATQSLRARYRRSLYEAELIPASKPLRYDFERFNFIARMIRKGARLRLVFGPINSIYSEKNYNTGGEVASESVDDARTVEVRLYHDGAYPSVLSVPLGGDLPS